jgi:hypothetical protein
MTTNGTKVWTLAKWEPIPPPDTLDKEKTHSVAFLAKQADFDCLMLAEFGMSMKTISGYTGLSIGQVSYRLKKAGVFIQDFRNGRGPYAAMVFQYLNKPASRQLIADVREKFTDV